MEKLSNTEFESKKSLTYKKKHVLILVVFSVLLFVAVFGRTAISF